MTWVTAVRDIEWSDDNAAEIAKGWVLRAESIEDLARQMGRDPVRVRDAFERYEAGVVQVLHLQFETAGVAQTAQGRRRQHQHAAFLHDGQFLTDAGEEFFAAQIRVFAVLEFVEHEERCTDVRLVRLQHR